MWPWLLGAAFIAGIAVWFLGVFWTCTEREQRGSRVIRRWRNGLGTRHSCVSLYECPTTWHELDTGELSFLSVPSAEMEREHQRVESEMRLQRRDVES